jgi:hypothetical protein
MCAFLFNSLLTGAPELSGVQFRRASRIYHLVCAIGRICETWLSMMAPNYIAIRKLSVAEVSLAGALLLPADTSQILMQDVINLYGSP